MRSIRHILVFSLTFAFLFLALALESGASSSRMASDPGRIVIRDVQYLGQALIPAGTIFQETEVGGLSGLAYDAERNIFYALSDDRGERGPARFYSMRIDLSGNNLQSGDLNLLEVTELRDENGQAFPEGGIDPEAIVYDGEDQLYIASEGVGGFASPVDPFVNTFGLDGRQVASLPIPAKFLPDGSLSRGVRNNLSFESLTLRPDSAYLFTATENALIQDSPAAGLLQPSHSRILAFDQTTGNAAHEWVYVVEPVQAEPNPPEGEAINGLVELLALDNNGSFLALERSFSQGVGFSVRLYLARAQGALDVQGLESLLGESSGVPLSTNPPITKELLVDLADLSLFVDNVEGMAFGPRLDDGRQSLILVSDNNFNPFLGSRFIALALTLETIPAARPARETVPFLNGPATGGTLAGTAADPAIWLHPSDPDRSLVIVAAREGGLLALDLNGEVVQAVPAAEAGDGHFEGVDLLYRFPLAGMKVDLAVATDSHNNTLAVWRIDSVNRRLVNVTSDRMPRPIFSSGGGEVEHLAAYQSPFSGSPFVFLSQPSSNHVGQFSLTDDGNGKVTAALVRSISLPAGSLPGGVAADRLLGDLYVVLANKATILKYAAEPDRGDAFTAIDVESKDSIPGMDALAVYYGPGDTGYLLASSAKAQSFTVIGRGRDHETIGSFIIGDDGDQDQVNYPVGLGLFNSSLGIDFASGIVVAQDSVNAPQALIVEPDQARNGNSNFKYIPWERIAGVFPETLLIDTSTFNPRYALRNLLPLVIGSSSAVQ